MRPVIVWAQSRSRSSLVAKIFINHGLWWGDTIAKSCGYITYENQTIKNLVKRYRKKAWHEQGRILKAGDYSEFLQDLAAIVPDQQWMLKISVDYFQAFQALKPYNILVKRKQNDVVGSLLAKRDDLTPEAAAQQVQERFAFMEAIFRWFDCAIVDTDKLIKRDFSDMEKALNYCGIDFDVNAALAAFND